MFYYLTYNPETEEILSYGERYSSDYRKMFSPEPGIVLEIEEKEYNLISACCGDIMIGILTLNRISGKIKEDISKEDDDKN